MTLIYKWCRKACLKRLLKIHDGVKGHLPFVKLSRRSEICCFLSKSIIHTLRDKTKGFVCNCKHVKIRIKHRFLKIDETYIRKQNGSLIYCNPRDMEKNKIRKKYTVKILLSVSNGEIYFVYFQTLCSLVRGCSGSLWR